MRQSFPAGANPNFSEVTFRIAYTFTFRIASHIITAGANMILISDANDLTICGSSLVRNFLAGSL